MLTLENQQSKYRYKSSTCKDDKLQPKLELAGRKVNNHKALRPIAKSSN